jgi:tetratricopeptide (TPR) repeat protein
MGLFDRILGKKDEVKSYYSREGVLADLEDLLKQLYATKKRVDIHFSYLNLIEQTYNRREEPDARALFKKLAVEHVESFGSIKKALLKDFKLREIEPGRYQDKGGISARFPHIPTFQYLATVYAEDGEYEKAIEVCEKAIAFGLHDWTKGDYQARIERIKKKMK